VRFSFWGIGQNSFSSLKKCISAFHTVFLLIIDSVTFLSYTRAFSSPVFLANIFTFLLLLHIGRSLYFISVLSLMFLSSLCNRRWLAFPLSVFRIELSSLHDWRPSFIFSLLLLAYFLTEGQPSPRLSSDGQIYMIFFSASGFHFLCVFSLLFSSHTF